MRRITWRHRVEYLPARLLIGALARLPATWADAVAGALGRFVFAVLRIRRGVVLSQIAAAYPEADRVWVRRTARAAYVHFAREMVAVAAFARTWPEGLRAAVEPRGLEALREAARAGGALIVTGHFGNWELAASALAAFGLEFYGVVQTQSNAPVDAWITRMRERLGIRLIYRGGTAAVARRILARRGILGLAADQDARGRGLFVPFFGRAASTHRGPAALALAFGAPLFIGALSRRGPGRRYRLEIELVDRGGAAVGGRERRSEARIRDLTARWVVRLERMIRVSPEQYFWHHRRWKSRPPGTPEPVAGTTPEAEPRPESEAREA
jgi:KDO2-lipid IV(A) lauroyltransferase